MKGKRVVATIREVVSCSERSYQRDCEPCINDFSDFEIESKYHNEKYSHSSYIVYDQALRVSYPWNKGIIESTVRYKSYDYKKCVGEKLIIRVSDGSITQVEEYSAAVRFSLALSLCIFFTVIIIAVILFSLNR